jgi:hypothetical protein
LPSTTGSMEQMLAVEAMTLGGVLAHHDTKYPEATAHFLKLPLSEEAKRKILWDNCARLYQLA